MSRLVRNLFILAVNRSRKNAVCVNYNPWTNHTVMAVDKRREGPCRSYDVVEGDFLRGRTAGHFNPLANIDFSPEKTYPGVHETDLLAIVMNRLLYKKNCSSEITAAIQKLSEAIRFLNIHEQTKEQDDA